MSAGGDRPKGPAEDPVDALLERALASESGVARLKHARPDGDHPPDPASEERRRRVEGALAEAQHCLSNGDFRRAGELAHAVLAIDEGNPMARLLVEEAADLPAGDLGRHGHGPRTPPRGIPVPPPDDRDSAPPPPPTPAVVETPAVAKAPAVPARALPRGRPARLVHTGRPAWTVPVVAAGSIVVLAGAAWLWWAGGRSGESEPAPGRPAAGEVPPAATPSPFLVPAPPVVATPLALPPPTTRALNPKDLRRAEDLLMRGEFREADELAEALLRIAPADARARELRVKVTAESRRAAEEALARSQQARGEAGVARGAELARGPFEAARRMETQGALLARERRWVEARAAWIEAARLFREAEDRARLDGARQRFEQARARAVEAGVPRTQSERFAEAMSAASRAQASSQRDPAAALREFEAAEATLETARAAALEAARAAALEAAAAPPPAARAESATPAPELEREAIAAVLARYAAALQQKDLGRLKSLWPSLGGVEEAKIRDSFQFAQSLTVTLDVLQIQVHEETAIATCRRRDRIVTLEGQTLESNRRTVVRLLKGSEGWAIGGIS